MATHIVRRLLQRQRAAKIATREPQQPQLEHASQFDRPHRPDHRRSCPSQVSMQIQSEASMIYTSILSLSLSLPLAAQPWHAIRRAKVRQRAQTRRASALTCISADNVGLDAADLLAPPGSPYAATRIRNGNSASSQSATRPTRRPFPWPEEQPGGRLPVSTSTSSMTSPPKRQNRLGAGGRQAAVKPQPSSDAKKGEAPSRGSLPAKLPARLEPLEPKLCLFAPQACSSTQIWQFMRQRHRVRRPGLWGLPVCTGVTETL